MSNFILSANEPRTFQSKLASLLNQFSPSKGVHQGVRKIQRGKRDRSVIFHYSSKNKALMPCESRLEANFCFTLDVDNCTSRYITQPFSLHYGSNQTYTPDVLCLDNLENITVYEVKTSGALESEKLRAQLELLRQIFSRGNIRFKVVTELQLPSRTELSNLRYLYTRFFINTTANENHVSKIQKFIGKKPSSLRKLRKFCNDQNFPEFTPEHLLFTNQLSANLKSPISSNTTIRLGE